MVTDSAVGKKTRALTLSVPTANRRDAQPPERPRTRIRFAEHARPPVRCSTPRPFGSVVLEDSPSPVYGAALLMRFGSDPIRGSNPRSSARGFPLFGRLRRPSRSHSRISPGGRPPGPPDVRRRAPHESGWPLPGYGGARAQKADAEGGAWAEGARPMPKARPRLRRQGPDSGLEWLE